MPLTVADLPPAWPPLPPTIWDKVASFVIHEIVFFAVVFIFVTYITLQFCAKFPWEVWNEWK